MGELMKFQLPTKTLAALALTFVLAPVPGSAAQNRSGAVVIPAGYAEKFIAGTPEAPAAVEFIHGKSGGHTRALLLKMPEQTLNEYALEEYKKLGCKTALILSETNNTASILSEIESIKDLLGDDELNIINENDNIILRTVTETLNYLYDKTIATTPLDETEYTGIENLPGVDGNPELTIGDSVNVLLKTVEYLIRTVDNMIIAADETESGEFYEEDDDWERVYSAEKVNELIEDVVEHTAVKNWNWRSAETHGTLNLVQNGEAIYFEVDGGELLR